MRGARGHPGRPRSVLQGLLLTILSLAAAATPATGELVGSVAGTVRAGGVPVANAWVTLMPVTPTGDWAGKPAQTTTDRDGRYVFGDLYAYHVKIHVRAPSFSGLASAYWPDAYSFATAGILRVASSGSTADVDLPVGGSISGRVVDADSGDPIIGARVQAHVDAPPGWEPVGTAGLGSGPGAFVIDGLPPVPVALQARPQAGSNHLGQWYDGAGFYGEADRVLPGTSDVVIRLREGAQVGGVVRDDRGAVVPGAAVTIVGCPALCPLTAIADDSGAYRINGVPPGPGIRAYADAAGAGLLNTWFSQPGQAGDTSFDLARGEVRDDVDFALVTGAVAVGRVLDAQTGEPISGVSVDLADVDNPFNSYMSQGVADPDVPSPAATGSAASGGPSTGDAPGSGPAVPPAGSATELVIGPVPPGEYSLIIYPGTANSDYVPVEVVETTGLDGAGLVTLSPGERVEFTVSLARQRPPAPDQAPDGRGTGPGQMVGGQAPAGGSAGWPGLFGGFLAPDGAGFLRLGA